jgi:hypothetical protein
VPDVARFTRGGVEFTDGSTAEPDVVVLATGYQPEFEFASPELLAIDSDGRPKLRLQMFSRTHPTLAVLGLLQPGSGLFSIVHWQAVTVARWLRLWEADPERAAAVWARGQGKTERRFTQARVADSSRHWFEVDHVVYLRALQRSLDELEGVSR